MLAGAVIYLHAEGRVWWCACGLPWPISIHNQSMHNSQHAFDLWSLSHVLHGFLFYGAFHVVARRVPVGWRFVAASAVEIAWEMLENSPAVIDRYRTATISFGYVGDSVGNSLGDIASCMAGFYLARRLGFVRCACIYVAVELLMLFLVRDNLALNTLMLIHPVEAVRKWQGG